MNARVDALARSLRTVQSYEGFAREYDALCTETLSADVEDALRLMLAAAGPCPHVLEIGSGPGREADFIESLGARVRRTDATRAFIELQAKRGKRCELLNILTDELLGPYDAILALCVLIHIDRREMAGVLSKLIDALRPGGAFLVSMREGEGETSGDYHTVYWQREAFRELLFERGFDVRWDARSTDCEGGAWWHFLASLPVVGAIGFR